MILSQYYTSCASDSPNSPAYGVFLNLFTYLLTYLLTYLKTKKAAFKLCFG